VPLDAPTGVDPEREFLRAARGDDWARPPPNWPDDLVEHPCTYVVEGRRSEAIRRLTSVSAVPLTRGEARLLSAEQTPGAGHAFLLRGFATNNSVSRAMITGTDLIVESNALGGLFQLRRRPCVAWLDRAPARIFTFATYDM